MFEFATASRIIFGNGSITNLANVLRPLGNRITLIYSGSGPEIAEVLSQLAGDQFTEQRFPIHGEPTLDDIITITDQCKEFGAEMVVGFGGGSVIDTGKAVAAMATNPGELLDYLEVIGKGKQIVEPPLPMIALPTTAGTGSEVTRNAVLSVPEKKMKVSLRSPWLYPRVALVDPELTASMPPALTAYTGMDALTQLIEPFICMRANPMVDLFCREGIERIVDSIFDAFHDGTNLLARNQMSWASLLGGLSLANAGLGAVHGFASPIGGMFNAPHGMVCACLLPSVFQVNFQALQDRKPGASVLVKFLNIAQIVTKRQNATIKDGIRWLQEVNRALRIPRLSSLGIDRGDFKEIVRLSKEASSMKANPIELTELELTKILEMSY